jgi:hypothetical protein
MCGGGEAEDQSMSRDTHGRRREDRDADDWLAEQGELNWLDDPRGQNAAAVGDRHAPSGAAGGGRGRSHSAVSADLIARRRIVAGLVVAGLVVVTVIAVVLATSGGGSQPGPTAAVPARSQPSQPQTLPGTTGTSSAGAPTTPVQTQPGSSSSTLTVRLPADGTLSVGDSGAAVVALQKALAALGGKVGEPDGSFGAATRAAVVAFQTAHGLDPDGIVGASTVWTLNQALAARG